MEKGKTQKLKEQVRYQIISERKGLALKQIYDAIPLHCPIFASHSTLSQKGFYMAFSIRKPYYKYLVACELRRQ